MEKTKADICIELEELTEKTIEIEAGKKYHIEVVYPIGQLYAKLFDETGEHVLADVSYEGKGPDKEKITGMTDNEGVLQHKDIVLRDYEILVDGQYDTTVPAIESEASEPHDQIVEGCQIEEEFVEEPDEEEDVEDMVFYPEMRKKEAAQ